MFRPTESSLRNIVFLNKNRTMDDFQRHICINVPSSETFRSYLVNSLGGINSGIEPG
jgi:hypothetical protein